MPFNTYPGEILQQRSDLATHLKYGEGQEESRAIAEDSSSFVKDIPFPKGLAPVPKPMNPAPKPDDSLPHVDVIAMMDTAAESQAMADVLTPGHPRTEWYPYTKNFQKYLPQIGPRGPSRMSKRLGSYFVTEIGKLKVLVYKTELHMHEDAKKLPNGTMSLPIKDMLAQMIEDARPRVFLTTGTSGGVYCSMQLGDVAVSRAARFQCMKDFASAPFNNKTFKSDWTIPTTHLNDAHKLMQKYADHLTGKSKPKGTSPDSKCACTTNSKYPTNIYRDGSDDIPEFHPILTTDLLE